MQSAGACGQGGQNPYHGMPDADDVGLININNPEIADQLDDILKIFPRTKTLLVIVDGLFAESSSLPSGNKGKDHVFYGIFGPVFRRTDQDLLVATGMAGDNLDIFFRKLKFF